MSKIHYKNVESFFQFTRQTWKKWNEESRPIANFVNRYLNDNRIEEFLQNGKIRDFDDFDKLQQICIEKNRKKYLNSFVNFSYGSLCKSHTVFVEFYYQFLAFCQLEENADKDLKFLIKKFLAIYSIIQAHKHFNLLDFAEDNLENILQHFDVFNHWDDSMLIFLQYSINNQFLNLMDKNDNQILQDEARCHIEKMKKYKKFFEVKSLSIYYFLLEENS